MITKKDLCLFDSIFSSKWNFLIISSLLLGEKRFSAIRKDIVEISDRLLSQKLKELIKYGIIQKEAMIISNSVKIIYKLTEKGEKLNLIFSEIDKWIIKNF
jgi:DNA-binding HxlR family transcriptional regulator